MNYKKNIYIIYILTLLIFGIFVDYVSANEIWDRRTTKFTKIDSKKDLLSKDKSQSIGNIYTISKNIYITDTMKVQNMTIGQTINYIKDWQKDCYIETWDIINIMSYDEGFDTYMKIVTNGERLKLMPWSVWYYEFQNASCLRAFWCLQKTNKLLSLAGNVNISSAALSKLCSDSIPTLYNRLNNNNQVYSDLSSQKIGNELYINWDETDGNFDLLADIKYISNIMYFGIEGPSKIFVHDIDKLKSELNKQQDIDASLSNNPWTSISYKPKTDGISLLAQNTNILDNASKDILQDPDIKKLLWDIIYNNLKNTVWSNDANVNPQAWSYIKSYINNINKSNISQDKITIQKTRDRANPISNQDDALSINKTSDISKKDTLKQCLKSCLNTKNASDSNACRNSCLCGQTPKEWWQTGADGKAWSFNSIMVLRYCVEWAWNIQSIDQLNKNQSNRKQTIEWLLMEIQDILQTINDKDVTPRTISRESFDFDLMLTSFANEFQFSVDTFTKDVAAKCKYSDPEYITQLDKVNSKIQNPTNLQLEKAKSDLWIGQTINCYISQNITFWSNMQKTINNIKQTAENLKNKI